MRPEALPLDDIAAELNARPRKALGWLANTPPKPRKATVQQSNPGFRNQTNYRLRMIRAAGKLTHHG